MNAQRTHVVGENLAQLVVRNLPDKSGAQPHRRRAGHAVGGRTAANFPRAAHRAIQIGGLVWGQQPHRAFFESLLFKEAIVAGRDDVDDGIANRDQV